MKEFIEKLIGRLEEKIVNLTFDESIKTKNYAYKNAIEIVNELAEEHSANTTQKSANGWIPCSERLPEMNQKVLASYEDRYLSAANGVCEGMYVYTWGKWDISDYAVEDDYKVIAWQPLPQPYQPKQQEPEWKDAVMKHFTKTE